MIHPRTGPLRPLQCPQSPRVGEDLQHAMEGPLLQHAAPLEGLHRPRPLEHHQSLNLLGNRPNQKRKAKKGGESLSLKVIQVMVCMKLSHCHNISYVISFYLQYPHTIINNILFQMSLSLSPRSQKDQLVTTEVPQLDSVIKQELRSKRKLGECRRLITRSTMCQ